jgi:hypothetical protein
VFLALELSKYDQFKIRESVERKEKHPLSENQETYGVMTAPGFGHERRERAGEARAQASPKISFTTGRSLNFRK